MHLVQPPRFAMNRSKSESINRRGNAAACLSFELKGLFFLGHSSKTDYLLGDL